MSSDERERLLSAAAPHLRCYILLCSDLAIRSGTAARLGPEHYNRASRTLTFRTKYQSAQHLPVTAELAVLLDTCREANVPFVAQLPRGNHPARGYTMKPTGHLHAHHLGRLFQSLRKRCGIARRVTPHDLRRTTARAVYGITGDLRDVQALLGHGDLNSTVWYMQGDLVPVPVSTLELAKLPPLTEAKQ